MVQKKKSHEPKCTDSLPPSDHALSSFQEQTSEGRWSSEMADSAPGFCGKVFRKVSV